MAYDAAVDAAAARTADDAKTEAIIHNQVIALFESTVVMDDLSWFVEHDGMRRADASHRDAYNAEALLSRLDDMLDASGAEPWVVAPMVSETSCHEWILGLPAEKAPEIIPDAPLTLSKL